ncbi:LysR family transcriptional regulator [Duganella sp. sic0402]|uniref:LysR family transcriptional regulator n=1 Tax=Duganella sp. sic0402 TaxID=2854786 RepID=UPI001C48E3B3|nr:LysR family transcriptional regulator [Duganella sp. sic0402]MBV7534689.1 LysR family transcriptional regulator [Duganella sp. sic0402]
MAQQAQFDGISEFILTAQLQSFTAVAHQLGVTSSAVGKAVSRLETRLGLKLLHRTTRKLTLTNDGEAYLAACLRVTEDLANTENCLSTGLAEPRGLLRIDLPGAFGRRYIGPTLITLVQRHPALDLALSFGDRITDMIADGIDLAVRIGDLHDDAELVARQLGEQHLVICAAPVYLRQRGTPMERADLLEHDCIISWRRGGRASWLLKVQNGQIEEQEIQVRHSLDDGEMILQSVLDGCGLAQLPTWLVHQHLISGELVTVLDQHAGASMPIHAIWPRTRYIQPKVRVVIDGLLQLASDQPDIFRCGAFVRNDHKND